MAGLREPNAALLFVALSEAITQLLVAELWELCGEVAELRQGDTEVQELRDRIAALEAQKARPPGAMVARIDRALEVELEPQAPPAALEDDTTGASTSAGDGPMVRAAVRAARWFERRLRGGRE